MRPNNFQISILVNATPHEAFECINDVTKWWTENLDGESHKQGDEFAVRFADVHYSKQRLVEFIPDKKVAWLITESRLNFIKDKEEWTNTQIEFEISTINNQTQVVFTQIGLVPEIECYDACSNAWSQYIQQSLYNLITKGKGKPEKKEVRVYP
jgi:hypothetical protein